MKNSTNLLPGMVDKNVEMFVQNNELKVIQGGKIIPFAELAFATISILEEEIAKDKLVELALLDMHPHSKIKRTEQFAKCRLGGLDFKPDIENNVLQDGEYWPCPKRGNCPHEGLLCKLPVINGQRLNNTEVKIMQLSATEITNDVMAEVLELPLGTLHKIKKGLYDFMGIQTKQEATLLSKFHNLI